MLRILTVSLSFFLLTAQEAPNVDNSLLGLGELSGADEDVAMRLGLATSAATFTATPESPPSMIARSVNELGNVAPPPPLSEASPFVVTLVDALKSIGILCIAVSSTRRSVAALGDAEFNTEYFERGVYSARWLFESLATLFLAAYYMVGFFRAAWAASLAEAVTAAASCFFFVRLRRLSHSSTYRTHESYIHNRIPPLHPLPASAVHGFSLACS